MAHWLGRKSILSDNIVIIDYKMGNLKSVEKAFAKVGADVIISNDSQIIKNASKIVLPGVGAFKDGMKYLKELGLIDVLHKEVLQNKKPFLGICLGMQLIAKKSYENGKTEGLGWIDGIVVKFDSSNLKVPHVGWNNVTYKKENVLFKDIPNSSDFYFVHSYHFTSLEDAVTSSTDYGDDFVSSLQKENIFAVQFHPEKSQKVGLKFLENFVSFERKI
ncbi:MAG TPA: imidazole glycerol phosphate synthase subunit HisH [Crocinitomix sp.]|nr:imidazole glycerol phosphate synthase subunit HisH [Crocinitomix sp.]